MAEARAVKFYTTGDYNKYCQRHDKSPLNGAWFCSRDPLLYAKYGLRKNSPRHSSTAINNVVDDRLLLIAPTVLEATLRLRPKLHRFDLSLYLLQSWLYNICSFLYRVSKKLCQCYYIFLNNSVTHWRILIIFGMQHHEQTWHK